MRIRVLLFAVAKQLARREAVELDLEDTARVRDLRAALLAAVPELAPLSRSLLFAVGQEYVDDQQTLEPGDEVACIPPVSGG